MTPNSGLINTTKCMINNNVFVIDMIEMIFAKSNSGNSIGNLPVSYNKKMCDFWYTL